MVSGWSCDGSENPLRGSVPSVPLWFNELLESIDVNDPEVDKQRSRHLPAVAGAGFFTGRCHLSLPRILMTATYESAFHCVPGGWMVPVRLAERYPVVERRTQ